MGQDGSQPRWHALGRRGVRVASWAQVTSGPTWPGGPWVGLVASWPWPGSSSFGKTVLGVIPGNSQEPFCCSPNGFTNIYLPASNSLLFTTRWRLTTIIKLLQKKKKEGQRRAEKTGKFCFGTMSLNYSHTLVEMNHFNSLIDSEISNTQQMTWKHRLLTLC